MFDVRNVMRDVRDGDAMSMAGYVVSCAVGRCHDHDSVLACVGGRVGQRVGQRVGKRVGKRVERGNDRGAVSILAMMFLVIFSSLAAALAIVSQGNLATADSHLKINRALAASETGLAYIENRLALITKDVTTSAGTVTNSNATILWDQVVAGFLNPEYGVADAAHNIEEPTVIDGTLHIGPIPIGPNDASTFEVELTQHPLPGEDYTSAFYRQPAFESFWTAHVEAYHSGAPIGTLSQGQIDEALATWEMDSTWVRVKVIGTDGPVIRPIRRAISVDFKIDKKIRYALLSKSRVMIGRNVIIDGPVGSWFTETSLTNGHPIQMESDFLGINGNLDTDLSLLRAALAEVADADVSPLQRDMDHDNRLHVDGPEASDLKDEDTGEIDLNNDGIHDDVNGDGYIDDYDFFMSRFDTDNNGSVSVSELEANVASPVIASQLMELIDTFGDAGRIGLNDNVIDDDDQYAKIRGQVEMLATLSDWESGAAQGTYQDFFSGPVHSSVGKASVSFDVSPSKFPDFENSYDTSVYEAMATGDLASQTSTQIGANPGGDPDLPLLNLAGVVEEVPYGAAHPYDFYERPVYENMTFTNVKIPKGTNALFINCTFIGVTFVETAIDNDDPDFNYTGMLEEDGTLKYPEKTSTVDGMSVTDTKDVANNIRFDDCVFEGAVVSSTPSEFTHVRNKISFTGNTQFEIKNSVNLTEVQKELFERSTLLAPEMSVEMGSFTDPADEGETVELSGLIVAGVIDVRGQVTINGQILTTFQPVSNEGPVDGQTSPWFNTTLGYFGSDAGDLEAEIPDGGWGVIKLRYDPSLGLPDGFIDSSIEVVADRSTYFEVKAN